MVIRLFLLTILVEALVQLWFKAAPLQPIREWLIEHTPFLDSERQGNLFNCPYCMSVWIGFAMIPVYLAWDSLYLFVLAIAAHRLANYLHLGFSIINDKQIDLRIARGKK